MADTTLLGLTGASPALSVIDNLKTSPPALKTLLTDGLNAALKSQLSDALTKAALPVLAGLVQKMPSVDLVAASNLSVQAVLQQQIGPLIANDPVTQQTVDRELKTFPITASVASFLGLDQLLLANPIVKTLAVKSSVGSLLATSPTLASNQQLQTDFVNRYAASDGSTQDFWQSLTNDPEFKSVVPELALTFELGALAPDNPVLITALRKQYQPASVKDLVKLSANDWAQLITSNNVPIPSSINGNTPGERTANYVDRILRPLKSALASDYIKEGLSQAPLDAIDQNVSQFLNNSPDFDFVRTQVSQYLAKNPKAWTGIAAGDQPEVLSRINGYQRLSRLNSDFVLMTALMAKGLDSAYKIAQRPREAFLRQFTQVMGGRSQAEALYAAAKGATASALNLYQSVREGLTKVHPGVFGEVQSEVATAVQEIPDWQKLFGSTSACACQDCKSVLSAAAYLTDLLHFLSNAQSDSSNPSSPSLLSILSTRRPDLVNLKLNCENTNTTLPYVDLVNEILEGVVVSKTGQLPSLPAYNTAADATSDELQVNPEFTNEAAYVPLQNSFYPFSLPFDRYLSAARNYLEFAGSSLWEVMKTYQVGLDPAVPANSNLFPSPSDQTIAREYAKISDGESLILTGKPYQGTFPMTNSNDLSRYYGYRPSGFELLNIIAAPNGAVRTKNIVTITTASPHFFSVGQLINIFNVADPSFDGAFVLTDIPTSTTFTYSQAIADATSGSGQAFAEVWYVDLSYVPTFLRRAGVSYDDLVALVETHFLNPSQLMTLQAQDPQNVCDINSMVIDNLVPKSVDLPNLSVPQNMYRFIRLYSKLGWQITDLDKAITALGATDINDTLLANLSEAKQLQDKYNLNPLEILALWANLDTEGADSLYASLFQNKGGLATLDPGLTLRYAASLPSNSTVNLSFLNPYGVQLSWNAGQLQFKDSNGNPAVMTANQERFLLSLSPDVNYQQAVVQLFLQNPAPLAALPAGLVLPMQLPDAIYYQGTQLYFAGQMSDDLWSQIKFLSPDAGYQLAIDNLHDLRWAPGTEIGIATQTLASQAGQLIPAQTVATHAGPIAAALGISAADLAAIFTYLWKKSLSSQTLVATPGAGGSLATGNYYVVVAALDTFGEFLSSEESPAIPVTGPSGSIAASWAAVPGATSYNVYFTAANKGSAKENLKVSTTTTNATITTTALGGAVSLGTPPLASRFPLNLANLSAVYRYARLAQALGLSVANLISLIDLSGVNSFQPSTPNVPGTIQFATIAQQVLGSAFSVPQLDYIYRNITNPLAGLGPQQSDLIQLVASLQSSLNAPPAETRPATDPSGLLLQKYLACVLSTAEVAQAMGLIAGTSVYTAPLAVLPSITFPPGFSSISFDQANQQLLFTGPMSQAQQTQLTSLSAVASYQTAIQNLYQSSAPAWNAVYTSPASANPLPTVAFPASLTGLIAYANANTQLTFKGPMSATQLGLLTGLSSDPNYQNAINSLFAQSAPAWNIVYSAALTILPPISFPAAFSIIFFDKTNQQLLFTGPMSQAQQTQLTSLSAVASYQTAIQNLYQSSTPAWNTVYTSPASANPLPTVAFPASLTGLIAYANANTQLTFKGPMSAAQLGLLARLSSDPNYQNAINSLFAQSGPAWIAPLPAQSLSALPPIVFPDSTAGSLASRLKWIGGNLQITGALSTQDEAILLGLSSDPNYQLAIEQLYLQPRQFLITKLYFLDTRGLIALLIDGADASVADKYGYLLNALLKAMSLVIQTVSQAVNLDADLTRLLLVGGQDSSSTALLKSISNPSLSAIADFFALQGTGLLAAYYPNPGFGGAIGRPAVVERTFDFSWSPTSVPFPGFDPNAFSAKWSAQLLSAFSETYTFSIRVVPSPQAVLPFANAPVTLSIGGTPLALALTKPASSSTTASAEIEYTATADLGAGLLTPIELGYPNAAGCTLLALKVTWSSLSTPESIISQHQLFADPSFTLDRPLCTYRLLLRIALLLSTFNATTPDLTYLASNSAGFTGIDPTNPAKKAPFDLNLLPANPSAYSPAWLNQWQRLLSLFGLRDSLAGGDAGLLAIFAAAGASPAPPASSLIAPIVAATGWSSSDVGLLLGSQLDPLTGQTLGFGLSAGDFTDERWLARFQSCLALAARFKASSKQLYEWAALGANPAGTVTTNGTTVTWVSGANFSSAWTLATIFINGTAYSIQSVGATSLTLSTAAGVQAAPVPFFVTGFVRSFEPNVVRDIQAALKSQYSDATWVQLGKSLNDKLRQSSRDALVSYILAHARDWELTIGNATIATPDQLYEYFLIDVEMGTCMQTSRVVQATAAVQLFVQRCLLNLEAKVSPSAIDATIWNWMQNYRVWQANREVFLFPEDFMDPSLRDDKSPFFRELETELQQNPLTPESAEQALVNYLEKVDQVARLDIRSMYWNYEPNSQPLPDGTVDTSNDLLHVFGRTPSSPNIYYYRRLTNASQLGQSNSPAQWTPWEKVNVDIQADQLVPVVWDGRLYVFWPVFTESSDPTAQPPTNTANSAPPKKILKIQIAWSRYTQSGWSPKQVSTDSLIPQFFIASGGAFTSEYTGPFGANYFLFTSAITPGGDLLIRIWTPRWGSYLYGPGNPIPGQGSIGPYPQTQAVFEGEFIFTGCSNDGTILYQDPIFSWWVQNYQVNMGLFFTTNCAYFSENLALDNGASRLTLQNGNAFTYSSIDFLTTTPSLFRLAQSNPGQPVLPFAFDFEFLAPNQPLVYQDDSRSYFINPMGSFYTFVFTSYLTSMQFRTFWHPHACSFIKTVNRYGVPALMSLITQQRSNDGEVVSGFVLSTSGTLTPGLTPGTLYAQGQLFQTTAPLSVPAMPPSSTQQLFCGPQGNLYYSPLTKPTPGDALIGKVVSSATAITQVIQGPPLPQPTLFADLYSPSSSGYSLAFGGFVPYISGPFPTEDVDFSFDGAYSIYNWELFFHIPLLIATQFMQDQQFDEARNWFHFIFNPTTNSTDPVPQRYWNFRPFYNCSVEDEILGPLERLLGQLRNAGVLSFPGPLGRFSTQVNWVSGPTFDNTWIGATLTIPIGFGVQLTSTVISVQSSTSLTVNQGYWAGVYSYTVTFSGVYSECGRDVPAQLAAWRVQPFDPFLLGRLRTIAFRKTVVMKYIDNLIAWGDFLFGQNTRESINEATQLYVLAQQILGDKPVTIPSPGVMPEYTYSQLSAQGLDDFSNVLVNMENAFPFGVSSSPWLGSLSTEPVNSVASGSFYFCIPQDDQLLGYWDTVADRLYKIRHCMNISGQVEQLPLFAAPINPALLVRATAAGADLSSVLNDINTPTGNYRFTLLCQKALELCAEVRSLGAALLSSLEKKDAEGLALLRTTQEISLLQAVLQLKQSQIDEANDNLAAAQGSQGVTLFRQQYYQSLIAAGLSSFEKNQVASLTEAQSFQSDSQTYEIASGEAGLLPNFTVGSEGISSPVATATFGGIDLQAILTAQSRALAALASLSTYSANMMGLTGGWDRRAQEWNFQQQLASKELAQIQSQIDAAGVRVQIAQQDLQNQQLQIANSQATLDFMRSKYTNEDLYSWMISEISAVYFQCYQMAYGLAKRAEAALRFELGLTTSNFIQFGYWDNLHKGLLAGEGLYCDLKRMELVYLDQNSREYEITKYISLVLLDPVALIALKETGQCLISLPEAYFDMDYPGHYMRRMKSVSLTIPCVTGPYTSVNCKLTLVSSKIRVDNSASGPLDYLQDSHFIANFAATQSIATSSAQNDSGMFELNFRDERYLPFEGAGVISQWLVELPQDCNAFDFESISDFVLNLRYTARDGGDALRATAKQAAVLPAPSLQTPIPHTPASFPKQNNLARFFSLRHEFPSNWYKFLNPLNTDTAQTMALDLSKERFPFQFRGKKISISQVDLLLKFKNINDSARFKSGTPLGDFGTAGLLNVYVTPAGSVVGQPQAPTQPPPNASPVALKSVPTISAGAPSGSGQLSAGLGLVWLQLFTSANYLGTVAPTLLDANNHLLPTVIEDIFLVCHFSAT